MSHGTSGGEEDTEKLTEIRSTKRIIIAWLRFLLMTDRVFEAERVFFAARDSLINSSSDSILSRKEERMQSEIDKMLQGTFQRDKIIQLAKVRLRSI